MPKDTILTLIEWVAEERKIYTLRVVNPGPNAKSRVSSVRTDPEGIRARRLIRLVFPFRRLGDDYVLSPTVNGWYIAHTRQAGRGGA